MSNTRGKCDNQKRCLTASSGRIIDVPPGTAFTCPECGGELTPFRATLGTPLPVAFVVFLALQVACLGCMAWTWISRAGVHKVFASSAAPRSNPEPTVSESRVQSAGSPAQAGDFHTHDGVVHAPPRSRISRREPAVSETSPALMAEPVIVMRPPGAPGDSGKNNCVVGTGCRSVGQAPAEEIQAPVVSELLADASLGSGRVPDWAVTSQVQMPTEEAQVSSGVSGGQIIRRVTPVYPEQARAQKLQGTVVLAIMIGEDGTVPQITVLSGPRPLADAAKQAVQQWRYTPFELNGKPVAIHSQVTIRFKLP